MYSRIDVDKEIRESKNHEQFKYIIILVFGVFLPVILWGVNYGKIESPIWWGFFTAMMFFISIFSLVFVLVKTTTTSKAVAHYKKVLTRYVNIDEKTHIPETAHVTMCLRPDLGRFGLQKINYFFWKEETELVFFPVRPEFLTSKAYHLVQSVRLNEVMVRSYTKAGNQYYNGVKDAHENQDPDIVDLRGKASHKPEYRDTRATLIAYAVGDQTIYLMFDDSLYDKLKEVIPKKDKHYIEELAKKAEEKVEELEEELLVNEEEEKVEKGEEEEKEVETIEPEVQNEPDEPTVQGEPNEDIEMDEPDEADETEIPYDEEKIE
ncbi:MAG: hypothetical protein A2009_05805 [Tenericutes bacterium GWD2_38_27]|nr:MAG: hypothetical protein A2009_05805 [Tenericutes bacterium GWD2_38_27]OHE40419.1 MAG: hypothetical protein A2102_00380 [Tenericutes bacterium GWF2_38_8]HBG33461.1 hypothetical protein [Acholeplasmataceae bacterium]HCB65987.1 hypothetical protein [Acholeplasmataceae bacterium]